MVFAVVAIFFIAMFPLGSAHARALSPSLAACIVQAA